MSRLSLSMLIIGGIFLSFLLVFTGFLIALNVYDIGVNNQYAQKTDPYYIDSASIPVPLNMPVFEQGNFINQNATMDNNGSAQYAAQQSQVPTTYDQRQQQQQHHIVNNNQHLPAAPHIIQAAPPIQNFASPQPHIPTTTQHPLMIANQLHPAAPLLPAPGPQQPYAQQYAPQHQQIYGQPLPSNVNVSPSAQPQPSAQQHYQQGYAAPQFNPYTHNQAR